MNILIEHAKSALDVFNNFKNFPRKLRTGYYKVQPFAKQPSVRTEGHMEPFGRLVVMILLATSLGACAPIVPRPVTEKPGGVLPPDQESWRALSRLFPYAANTGTSHMGAALQVQDGHGVTIALVGPVLPEHTDPGSVYPLWIREEWTRMEEEGFRVIHWRFSPREVLCGEYIRRNGGIEIITLTEPVRVTPEVIDLAHEMWRRFCRHLPCNGNTGP